MKYQSGPGGGGGSGGGGGDKKKRRKESILDLSKYLEKTIRVKFAGGREAAGVLKGYDPLLNLVLDNTVEFLRDPDDWSFERLRSVAEFGTRQHGVIFTGSGRL